MQAPLTINYLLGSIVVVLSMVLYAEESSKNPAPTPIMTQYSYERKSSDVTPIYEEDDQESCKSLVETEEYSSFSVMPISKKNDALEV